ncbi:MAG TPA: glycine betaine ABC transporter substrate-binding protein [Bryobacteraceae bacterium]|jgi:glycine betaine/choline ABC-type transport system substrate-binding protein|nr:glycine betaine ABC transporter substrate-binding protein [Bryobacteraceae bacterium]
MKVNVALLPAALCLLSCGAKNQITVGSKNFTEQIILGEMAAQQIERKLHLPVRRQLDLGGTLLSHQAIVRGDIDIYPEYTGTAASAVLKQAIPADPVQAYTQVKDAYFQRFHLVWLPPLGFNDTFAMVVRNGDAQRLARPDLSAAVSRPWRLGVGYEFLTRPDGLERLNKVYGLPWRGTPQTMDLGLLYQALAQQKVDMAAGNSTDGLLDPSKFKALADDKKAFPPYNACFIVRKNLLDQHPEVKDALTMLSGHLDENAMRELNRRVDIDHQPIVEAVKKFLAKQP